VVQLQSEVSAFKAAQAVPLPRSTVLAQHSPQGWNSVIIWDFLEIFTEFRGQRFCFSGAAAAMVSIRATFTRTL
jgi:hypothetical protein